MPASKKRTKRSAALSGIPQSLVSLAPGSLSDADKAQWCRYYLAGVEDRALTPPFGKRLPDWAHRAHRRGKDDATTRKADASHVAALDSRRSKRIQKREDRIDAMDDAAIERQVLLQERLSRLGGGDGELGPIAERLARGLAVAMGVPGMLGFNKK
jgi:hypothetical protein